MNLHNNPVWVVTVPILSVANWGSKELNNFLEHTTRKQHTLCSDLRKQFIIMACSLNYWAVQLPAMVKTISQDISLLGDFAQFSDSFHFLITSWDNTISYFQWVMVRIKYFREGRLCCLSNPTAISNLCLLPLEDKSYLFLPSLLCS